jgi:membrane-associated phospholipid phosphatase
MKNISVIVCFWLSLAGIFEPAMAQRDTLPDTSTYEDQSQPEKLVLEPGPAFEFSLKKDLPIMAGSAVSAIAGLWLMEQVPPLTEADIAALNPDDISAFDRGGTRQYRFNDANLSDYLLTFSALTPLTVLASRPVRKEFGPVLVMYIETAAMVGGLTSISKGFFKRKRPYNYNPDVPMADKLSVDARHSFFSGHVSTSAAFTFLTAYMVNRYAERPVWKWVAWSGAVVVPGAIGYWRYTSGKHFPTDILVGYLVGGGTGILIPYLHRGQLPEEVALDIYPVPYGVGLTLTF